MRRAAVWIVKAIALSSMALAGSGIAARADEGTGALELGNTMTLKSRALLTAEGVYLFGEPELIAQKSASAPWLSTDGHSLLVSCIRTPVPLSVTTVPITQPTSGELDILFWDSRTRQPVTIYREPFQEGNAAYLESIDWLPGSHVALIKLLHATNDEGGLTLMRVDTTAPVPVAHRVLDMAIGDRVLASPVLPLACVVSAPSETGAVTLRVIRPNIAQIREVAFPDRTGPLRWTLDGASVFSTYTLVKTSEGKWTRRVENTLVNLNTGQISHPAQPPVAAGALYEAIQKAINALPVRLITGSAKLSDEHRGTADIQAVWLEGAEKAERNPLLLTTGAKGVTLLADGNAALIQREEALYAIPLYSMSREAYAEAVRGAQKNAAMQNLKQIGLAILGYTMDNDENLPKSDIDFAQTLGPYLKNSDLFNDPMTGKNGFTFTYQGPSSLGQVGTPASTEMGRFTGPGGHAVLFIDGHVRWFDD